MPTRFSLAVVGAQYPNKKGVSRTFEITQCNPGEPVELRREPKNPADSRAIGVYSARGIQIGYIRAEQAQLIGSYMARGVLKCIFQRADVWGAVIRCTIDGSEPVLPEPPKKHWRNNPPAPRDDPDGWEPERDTPDDDWPPKIDDGDWGA